MLVLYTLSNPAACQLTQYDICKEDLNKEHNIMLCGWSSEKAGSDKAYHLACYHSIHLLSGSYLCSHWIMALYSNISKAAVYKKCNIYSMLWLDTALGDILKA